MYRNIGFEPGPSYPEPTYGAGRTDHDPIKHPVLLALEVVIEPGLQLGPLCRVKYVQSDRGQDVRREEFGMVVRVCVVGLEKGRWA